jgi:hypothetical protein
MTLFGAFVAIVFLGCYAGMMLGTRMEGKQGKFLQWGCWLLALTLITICHMMAPQSV